ncbi:MAG: transglycosylase domain-containing protein, partial [Nitrospirae bacterium]|nr:transglycosylase domain-containing protein [Nitrospirota bacterium]
NRIYFGHGAYGIEMAAKTYFGKGVSQITLPEAALIAGLIKAPNTYSPYNNLVKAKEQQEFVLQRMEEEGYIKKDEGDKARKTAIVLSSLRAKTESYNYFLEYIRRTLEDRYGADVVYKGGLKVYTTLNTRDQAHAQRALQDGLRDVDKRRGWRGPIKHRDDIKEDKKDASISFSAAVGDLSTGIVLKVEANEAVIRARGVTGILKVQDALWAAKTLDPRTGKTRQIKNLKLTDILNRGDIIWVRFKAISGKAISFSLEQDPEIEGAFVAIEPDTGYIKALIGGFSFTKSEYNRAAQAKRQPGSAFKPVIFAAALEHGFTPSSILVDEEVSYYSGPGEKWKPENYDKKFHGPTSLREALAYSRNIITVKLVEALGIDKVLNFARAIGIEAEMPRDFTIAL